MNGVLVSSCNAIHLLHTSCGSVSGLTRYGNSITLPLPNLIAQLVFYILPNFVQTCFLFCFCKATSDSAKPPFFVVQTERMYIHMFGASLCKVNICLGFHCVLIGFPAVFLFCVFIFDDYSLILKCRGIDWHKYFFYFLEKPWIHTACWNVITVRFFNPLLAGIQNLAKKRRIWITSNLNYLWSDTDNLLLV